VCFLDLRTNRSWNTTQADPVARILQPKVFTNDEPFTISRALPLLKPGGRTGSDCVRKIVLQFNSFPDLTLILRPPIGAIDSLTTKIYGEAAKNIGQNNRLASGGLGVSHIVRCCR